MDVVVTITLIVPVYNVEKYLPQCLESIARQTVSFDEVILVNDGSTDQSQAICEKYILQYDYFKLINQKNKGPSSARNAGLDSAVCEYVMFLDSDDYLREDTVERLKNELSKTRVDAVYFDTRVEYERGCEFQKNIYGRDIKNLAGTQMSGAVFFEKCYPENYIISSCFAVYRKEAVEAAGVRFPEGLFYEDNYFTFAFMIKAKNVIYIPEKLYQRRYRANSTMTSKYTEKKLIDTIKITFLVWEEVITQKDITLPENKIYLKVINDYFRNGLEGYRLSKNQNIILHDNCQNIFGAMIKRYMFIVWQYCLNDNIELILLNRILKNIKKIILLCPEYKMTTKIFIKEVKDVASRFDINEKFKQYYKKLLFKLPLDIEGCKVGVYGIGEHTEGLLAVYGELFGEIACNLVFIDSYKERESYLGRNIINYREIDNSFDLIIISSFLYRREMEENVRRINRKVPIYAFYDSLGEDMFSGWDLWLK